MNFQNHSDFPPYFLCQNHLHCCFPAGFRQIHPCRCFLADLHQIHPCCCLLADFHKILRHRRMDFRNFQCFHQMDHQNCLHHRHQTGFQNHYFQMDFHSDHHQICHRQVQSCHPIHLLRQAVMLLYWLNFHLLRIELQFCLPCSLGKKFLLHCPHSGCWSWSFPVFSVRFLL